MILETAAYEESAIENYWVKGLQFAEMDWHGLAIHNVLFTSCRFSGCHFEKASFRQTVLRNCDMPISQSDKSISHKGARKKSPLRKSLSLH